uniref:Uncharacterized protein n=1 Tax=Oryza meridionalis TaxID=40149 RepID=A0A0E0EY20_9ORYZ
MPTTQYRVCLTKNHQFPILKPLHQHLVLDTPIPIMTQLFQKKSQLIASVLGSKSNHWNHSLLLKKSFSFSPSPKIGSFLFFLLSFFFSLSCWDLPPPSVVRQPFFLVASKQAVDVQSKKAESRL